MLDFGRLEELGEAARVARAAATAQMKELAQKLVTGSSRDGLIKVRVNGAGVVRALRLEDGAMRRYDTTALSEMVTRTVRDTQLKARAAYEEAVAAITIPEIEAAQTYADDMKASVQKALRGYL